MFILLSYLKDLCFSFFMDNVGLKIFGLRIIRYSDKISD